MSTQAPTARTTSVDIRARKSGAPIASLTAYSANIAAIADNHVDFLLVGDSVGMVVHGYDTTVPVSLDLMITHGSAVVRGTRRALVVVDLPFGSYEESPQSAFRNAARLLKETGCGAVKLEGGRHMAETIRYLVERGIPVMGHVGLTPQSINTLGGFRAQGRSEDQWDGLEADAIAVSEADAFAIVLEAIAEPLAARLTKAVPIPTIGIGASSACDGQILVMDDMLGMSPRVPKFVRQFGQVGEAIDRAIADYATSVRDRTFPAAEHTYGMRPASKAQK